jgi:hypothetical protein
MCMCTCGSENETLTIRSSKKATHIIRIQAKVASMLELAVDVFFVPKIDMKVYKLVIFVFIFFIL